MALFEEVNDRFPLGIHLREAMERKEFRLYYQPKLDLVSRKIKGVEALIRWAHPEKGIISPREFIPVAEETGEIIPIGDWALRTACKQAKEWMEAEMPPMIMAINLSARQFKESDLVQKIQLILDETGLSPDYLELEITESMMMDVQKVLQILRDLKRIGVRISLDDFGTGYSSLYHLKEFPIDVIKIDQCFVRNCTRDVKDATIVKTIIAMAHQLNLEVIAEGIESRDHLIFLQQNLCDKGQGYLFSEPIPQEELSKRFVEIEKTIEKDGLPPKISKEKWLEQELERTRQELRDTIRQQQGMTFKYIKKGGKFIHTLCDGELLYRMGYCSEQIAGKELQDFLPHSVAGMKRCYYQRAWEGEENVTYEAFLGGIWYLASLRPIRRGGQVVEVIGSCVDISERKKVEDALRQSEEKYRLIADNMQDLIGILDTNGVVKFASSSHKTVLGVSPRNYEGHIAFERVHSDDQLPIQNQFASVVSMKTPCRAEFRYQHEEGSWVVVEAIGTPVLNEQGEVEHVLVVARDMSERKKM